MTKHVICDNMALETLIYLMNEQPKHVVLFINPKTDTPNWFQCVAEELYQRRAFGHSYSNNSGFRVVADIKEWIGDENCRIWVADTDARRLFADVDVASYIPDYLMGVMGIDQPAAQRIIKAALCKSYSDERKLGRLCHILDYLLARAALEHDLNNDGIIMNLRPAKWFIAVMS